MFHAKTVAPPCSRRDGHPTVELLIQYPTAGQVLHQPDRPETATAGDCGVEHVLLRQWNDAARLVGGGP
jgi:hypothetical protein